MDFLSPVMVIAHRGASAYAPENTRAAFDLAVRMGLRHIELDVSLTADGQVAVIHDATVERTTNGSGFVAKYTLRELQHLDAGFWFAPEFAGEPIPAYHDLLACYKSRVHLHTELKGRSLELAWRVVDLVREHGMEKQVTITSFQWEFLDAVGSCAPELERGWLLREISQTLLTRARAMGISQLCPPAQMVDPELVSRLHTEGFSVRA